MVWELFQSSQVRKNREELERVSRELLEVTALSRDLARRVVELEQRVRALESQVERSLPLLDRVAQAGERQVDPAAGQGAASHPGPTPGNPPEPLSTDEEEDPGEIS